MTHGIFIWILVTARLIGCSLGQDLRANFHMDGVVGRATFSWSAQTLTATLNMNFNLGQTTVEIHPIWVNYDAGDKCSTSALGDSLEGISAQAIISENSDVNVVFSNVSSLTYYEGHSLVLRSTGISKVICATIQQNVDHVTAMVRLRGSVFGHVYLRQATVSGGSSTRIVTDVATQSTAQTGKWRITNSFTTCDEFMKNVLNSIYDPTSPASDSCGTSNQAACAIGDLTSKHGQLNFVSSVGGSGRRAFTDSNLPLFGDNNVQNLLLIIIPESSSVKPACGKVTMFVERAAKAIFSNDGVSGMIEFRQKSPLDPTRTSVDLEGLSSKAGGYHVHMWPVPERETSSQGSMCAPERVSGHFNPFKEQVGVPSDVNYPAPLASTYDMYEVGDLSAKYGMLNDLGSKNETYTDYNLQLFGHNSIVGRSLVIHRNDATASRWVCVNIEPEYPVVAAEALFLYPVIGRVQFMQERDHPESETSVFVSLDYIDEAADTEGHVWMIGDMPLGDDMLDTDLSSRCLSAGSVYNPGNLWSGLNDRQYAQVCANNNPVACKTGDLAGKLGQLNIGNSLNSQDEAKKWFATGTDLPLSSPHSIIGKPLVIRSVENTASLACAEIKPVHPISLAARFNSGSVTGTVRFSQKVGFGSKQTMVETDLTGLSSGQSLRVYELPDGEGQEACNDLGDVFDPLQIGGAQPSPTTDDKYKLGDLSRITAKNMSYNLPLSGVNSIKGRSLVVVDNSGVVACATIDWDMPGWTMIHAMATFTGEVMGTISLHQHVHSDGAMSDTSILTDLKYSNDSKISMNHNWHTHEKLVTGDSQAATQRCMSTGPHYNPFRAAVGETAYASKCSRTNQLRCELGDQSMKTMTIDVGRGRKLHTDTFQPLFGEFTVLDRSIVVHVENRGAPRFTCADIVPHTMSHVAVTFKTPTSFAQISQADKTKQISKAYSDAIRAYPGEVIVVIQSSDAEETSVLVHFVGPRNAEMKSRFSLTMKNERNKLGSFGSIVNSAGTTVISFLSILCALLPRIIYLLDFKS